MRVDRVVPRELLVEVLREHLDVARLVDHLRRGVVLGVDPRHGLDDAGGAQQRALLTVQELREEPVLTLDLQLHPLVLGPVFERRSPQVDRVAEVRDVFAIHVGERELFLVDRNRPVEIGRHVPLRGLRLLVQLAQRAGCGRSPT